MLFFILTLVISAFFALLIIVPLTSIARKTAERLTPSLKERMLGDPKPIVNPIVALLALFNLLFPIYIWGIALSISLFAADKYCPQYLLVSYTAVILLFSSINAWLQRTINSFIQEARPQYDNNIGKTKQNLYGKKVYLDRKELLLSFLIGAAIMFIFSLFLAIIPSIRFVFTAILFGFDFGIIPE